MTTHFEQVYALAKNHRQKELEEYISENPGAIDACETGRRYFSAAARLAKENRQAAVQCLINLGADKDYIAYGAALGGHHRYAEELYNGFLVRINLIAYGAAEGGYYKQAEKLRKQHNISISFILQAAARGGHRRYVAILYKEYCLNIFDLDEQKAMLDCVASSAAIGGQRGFAEFLRLQYKVPLQTIEEGAKEGNHFAYAHFLELKRLSNEDPKAAGERAIELALQGIGKYLELQGSHLRFFSRHFERWRGENRAKFYQSELNFNLSLEQRLLILYALLASHDGSTLKRKVSQALGELSSEHARKTIEQILLKIKGADHTIHYLNETTGKIINRANNLVECNEFATLPQDTWSNSGALTPGR